MKNLIRKCILLTGQGNGKQVRAILSSHGFSALLPLRRNTDKNLERIISEELDNI